MTPVRRIIPIFIPHQGCPNDCVFCNQRKISGEIVPATADTLRGAIEEGLRKLPPGEGAELAFYGGSFTAIPMEEQTALLSAALPCLRAGKIREIRLSTRPDAVDRPRLELLWGCGVRTIELGAQSMDDGVLRASGRGHTAEDTSRASKLIKEYGFSLILQMMTGLPGDTEEKSIETAKRIIAIRPDGVRIYPTVILRGTRLYDLWRSGGYKEHTVEEAIKLGAVLLEMFEKAGIPVIRFGLNPSDELSGGEAAGGAYHPALGELARSRLYLQKARELLDSCEHGENVTFGVKKGCVSLMTGQKRQNILALEREFGLSSVKVRECEVPAGKYVIILH